MRRPTGKVLELALILADTACAVLALVVAALLADANVGRVLREGPVLLGGLIVLWWAISDRLGLSRIYRSLADLLSRAVVSSAILIMGVAALAFFTKPAFSRLVIGYMLVIFSVSVLASRLLLRALICRMWLRAARISAVIIGSGPVARELAEKIEEDPTLMCHVVGCLAPESDEPGLPIDGEVPEEAVPTVSISSYLARRNVQQVFIVLPNSGDPEVQKLVAECRNAGIDVAFVPHAYELYVSRAVTQDISGIPLIWIEKRACSAHFVITRTLADYLTALVLLVFAAPLMVVITALLRARGRHPFRRELRCGQAGHHFWMYRFNVDRDGEANGLEQFLASTSLSELPQLFNVLRGEMSVIGPRPEPPEKVERYSEWEKQRLLYKPGITGIAQVRGIREQHSSDEKARFDLQYPLSWCPLLDLTLITQTIVTILRRTLGKASVPDSARAGMQHFRSGPAAVPPSSRELLHADRSQSSAD